MKQIYFDVTRFEGFDNNNFIIIIKLLYTYI